VDVRFAHNRWLAGTYALLLVVHVLPSSAEGSPRVMGIFDLRFAIFPVTE